MGHGVQRFTDLRAWQTCDAYKKAVYRVCRTTAIANDRKLREQLEHHLLDAVDKDYISEESRAELDALAVIALQEVTGLMEYLLSPEALRNARLVRERRLAARQQRRGQRGLRRD